MSSRHARHATEIPGGFSGVSTADLGSEVLASHTLHGSASTNTIKILEYLIRGYDTVKIEKSLERPASSTRKGFLSVRLS